jgi:hypothetical protein
MRRVALLFVTTAALGAMSCNKDGGRGGDPPGNHSPTETPRSPTETPRTEVPDELVGTWEHGSIDFALWENYKEGHYAGRNATPTREAMTFGKNGDAKFYRYEAASGLYEELVDCEGVVIFHGDGTFTFRPVKGRKRFYDTRHPANNKDRALTSTELNDPRWAGTRRYTYNASSDPVVLRITVPGSAPYNWYKKR